MREVIRYSGHIVTRHGFREVDLCIFNAKTYRTLFLFEPGNGVLFPYPYFLSSLSDDNLKKFFIDLGTATDISLKSKRVCCGSASGEETLLSSSDNTTVESSTTDVDDEDYLRLLCNWKCLDNVSIILK